MAFNNNTDQEVIIDHLDDSDKDFSQSLEVQGDTKIHRVNMWTRNGKREKISNAEKKNNGIIIIRMNASNFRKKSWSSFFFGWEFEKTMSEQLLKGKGMMYISHLLQVDTFSSP